MKVVVVPTQRNSQRKFLRRIKNSLDRFISSNDIEIGKIVSVENTTGNTFNYNSNYYTLNDFEQIILTNSNGYELELEDYDYIIFNAEYLRNIETENFSVTKPFIPGCKIERKGPDKTKGVVVEKPFEDNNEYTFGCQYQLLDNSWSAVIVGRYDEWDSVDTMFKCRLTPLTKIKYIMSQNYNNDEKIEKIKDCLIKSKP
ncbi:MAG TPA: hypothetical protein PKD00_01495 [Burkholderiales bacterium]|nr:hypothetical protein [Burkholderiales bacterium]